MMGRGMRRGMWTGVGAGKSSGACLRGLLEVQLESTIAFAVILAVVLSACAGNSNGYMPENGRAAASRIALAGGLEAPDLPNLTVKSGVSTMAARRVAYKWVNASGDTSELDEVWPIPWPSEVFASPDEEILFSISLPAKNALAPEIEQRGATGRLDLWSFRRAYYAQEEPRPEHSVALEPAACDPGTGAPDKGGSLEYAWVVPGDFGRNEDNEHTLRLTVSWGDAKVTFLLNLVVAEKDHVEEVMALSKSLTEAAWKGNAGALSAMFPGWDSVAPPEGAPRVSPLTAHCPSDGKSLLWSYPGLVFKRITEPSVKLTRLGPSSDGPYGGCTLYCEVEVTSRESGKRERWAIEEGVSLERRDTWVVNMVSRSAVLMDTMDDRDALPGLGTLPDVTTRYPDDFEIVRVGPFYSARPWDGQKWSDDGEWLAFVAVAREEALPENTGQPGSEAGANSPMVPGSSIVSGLWAVKRDGSQAVRLLALDTSCSVWILDWAPDQLKVRFLAVGHMASGPHADKTGYWVAEADLNTRHIRDIAFIRYPRPRSFPGGLVTPEGRRHVIFRHTPDLWKVDMETGEMTKLADDLPSWDGLHRLIYSQSGWLAAWGEPFSSGRLGYMAYDLRTGQNYRVDVRVPRQTVKPGEQRWAHFQGWTPREEAVISLCLAEEVNHGEDSSAPAGAIALLLYTPGGRLEHEILVPSGESGHRIGNVAWSSDGDSAAIAVGPLSEPITGVLGFTERKCEAKSIYLWTRSGGDLKKVVDVSGQVQEMNWTEDGQAVDVWFQPSSDEDAMQLGVRVHMDGRAVAVGRPLPYDSPGRFGVDRILGRVGNVTFVQRPADPDALGSDVIACFRVGSDDEHQVPINDGGPLSVVHTAVDPGSLVLTGQVPDRYGRGSYWVYIATPTGK